MGRDSQSWPTIYVTVHFQRLKDIPIPLSNKRVANSIKKGLWYISISRNALIVFLTSAISYNWVSQSEIPFLLSGKVEPGIPSFEVPPFSMEYRNSTMGFVEMCSELGSGIIVIPLVAVLANIAIAKSFCEWPYYQNIYSQFVARRRREQVLISMATIVELLTTRGFY